MFQVGQEYPEILSQKTKTTEENELRRDGAPLHGTWRTTWPQGTVKDQAGNMMCTSLCTRSMHSEWKPCNSIPGYCSTGNNHAGRDKTGGSRHFLCAYAQKQQVKIRRRASLKGVFQPRMVAKKSCLVNTAPSNPTRQKCKDPPTFFC